jgi:hypothetical protein
MANAKKPVVLYGGPLDGLTIDVNVEAKEIMPMKHHFKAQSMSYRPLSYKLNASGRYVFTEYLSLK